MARTGDEKQVACILDNNKLYNGIWYTISECGYAGCSEMVYGDDNSIVIRKVFCRKHYEIIGRFLSNCGHT